jgi:hypothetical protein
VRRRTKKADAPRVWKTSEVFVAGRSPTVTYNPRNDRHLETEVFEYREQSGKALSVSGPSKSGKTVLIERIFPKMSAVWVEGGDLSSAENFWHRVADGLGLFEEIKESTERGTQRTKAGGIELGVPGLARGSGQGSRSSSSSEATERARRRPLPDLVRDALDRQPRPVVIDDFQYVPQTVRRQIARAIKTLITRTHVVLIAVPHEAFEPVRAEPDMDGRVWQVRVQPWSVSELAYIAREGFKALRIVDGREEIGRLLAETSYGAPFLMQQLSHDYALTLGVRQTAEEDVPAIEPGDWGQFFSRAAERTKPGVFDKLLRGPDPRGQERTKRRFKTINATTDVYGAVLFALSKVGVETPVSYRELVRALQTSLHEAPQSNQITSALRHMSDIAFNSRGSSDPALDFKGGEVHVMDPFLAFYLDYGPWIVGKPRS